VAGATATAMAAGKIFPLIEDEDEGMTPTDGGGDELGDVGGGCKSWRLRVKETLRAFSTYYLHFVQVFPSLISRRSKFFFGDNLAKELGFGPTITVSPGSRSTLASQVWCRMEEGQR
jgi:hypothetical protein